jgi:Protein of unknown function, DUF481
MLDHRSAMRRWLYVLPLFCVIPVRAWSAQPPPPAAPPATQAQPPAPQDTTAQKKPDYGQWWLVNARDVVPPPPGWLIHSEGQGSFANSTGSVSGYQYTFAGQSSQRKRLVTNQVSVSFNVQEQRLEDNRGFFKQTTARFTEMVLINITKPLNLITAVVWEKDEPKQVLHRLALFEGLAHNFTLGKGHILGLAGAIGYEDEHDVSSTINQDQGSATAYLQNSYNAPIAAKGTFSHTLEAFFDLVNTDDVRLTWNVNLMLQVTPHIGIGPAAQVRYDGQPVQQVQTTDTMVMIAVQIK